MQVFSASPTALFASLWKNQQLILTLTKREIIGRYRGSALGLAWSFFHPILLLGVYTFVFSMVFKARWNSGSDSKTEFALVLFAGLMVFNLFSECVSRAPNLIISNVNYVKKVVFPLEILPIVTLCSALFHACISFFVWLVFYFAFFGVPHTTLLWLPVVILPFLLFTLGISWMLASLGTYLRDVGQIIGLLMTVLLFLSPIFYPVSALPERFQSLMMLNPLTPVVEQVRDILMWGKNPDWSLLALTWTAASLIAILGFAWFQKTRKGFADVL